MTPEAVVSRLQAIAATVTGINAAPDALPDQIDERTVFEVWDWGHCGNFPRRISRHWTREEADAECQRLIDLTEGDDA